MPLIGFLPPDDKRVIANAAAVAREDGLVFRYRANKRRTDCRTTKAHSSSDSFWLADNFALTGRETEACALCERLLSHVGLVNTARTKAGTTRYFRRLMPKMRPPTAAAISNSGR
jgi:GH15 family glucan-1,4-alpha-glucosidase